MSLGLRLETALGVFSQAAGKATQFGGGQESEAQLEGRATGGRNSSKQEEQQYYDGRGVCGQCGKETDIEKALRLTGKNSSAVRARCKNCGASRQFSIAKCKLTVWVPPPPPPPAQQQQEEQPQQQQEEEAE